MKKYKPILSSVISIKTENIDTDQIIPAQFLKTTERIGLGKYLFYNWRYGETGKLKNKKFNGLNHLTIEILVAGNNFGCGSSREHAVWALQDFGFAVVISSSFGDIFYNNSLKNGLLPVVVKDNELRKIFSLLEKDPKTKVTIDLEKQKVIINSKIIHFSIDTFRKECLLKGVDELGYILSFKNKIIEYEKSRKNYIKI